MSGGYTARTGRDILDLPFHLLVDVCHSTIIDRVGGDKEAWEQWTSWVGEKPRPWVAPDLPYAAAAAVVDLIDRWMHGAGEVDPAGWDDASLLRQMQSASLR